MLTIAYRLPEADNAKHVVQLADNLDSPHTHETNPTQHEMTNMRLKHIWSHHVTLVMGVLAMT